MKSPSNAEVHLSKAHIPRKVSHHPFWSFFVLVPLLSICNGFHFTLSTLINRHSLHNSTWLSVDCIFIVYIYKSTFKYIKLFILLISTLNLNCFNGTLLKCECGNEWEKKCPFSIFIGTKMPFESWYSRGMACEHLNIFIFPGWSEFIWSQLYMNTEAQRRRNTSSNFNPKNPFSLIFENLVKIRDSQVFLRNRMWSTIIFLSCKFNPSVGCRLNPQCH